jgi:hypothetical protein
MRVAEVRTWALGHLQLHESELAQLPDLVRELHWNPRMADYDVTRDAVFAVMMFRHSGIEILVGRGAGDPIRMFCEHDFASDVEQLPRALDERFQVHPLPIIVPRDIAEQWLGRTIHPQEA